MRAIIGSIIVFVAYVMFRYFIRRYKKNKKND